MDKLRLAGMAAGLMILIVGIIAAAFHVLLAMPDLTLLGRTIRLLALAAAAAAWGVLVLLVAGYRLP